MTHVHPLFSTIDGMFQPLRQLDAQLHMMATYTCQIADPEEQIERINTALWPMLNLMDTLLKQQADAIAAVQATKPTPTKDPEPTLVRKVA